MRRRAHRTGFNQLVPFSIKLQLHEIIRNIIRAEWVRRVSRNFCSCLKLSVHISYFSYQKWNCSTTFHESDCLKPVSKVCALPKSQKLKRYLSSVIKKSAGKCKRQYWNNTYSNERNEAEVLIWHFERVTFEVSNKDYRSLWYPKGYHTIVLP